MARVCVNSDRSNKFALDIIVLRSSWNSKAGRSLDSPSINASLIEIDDELTGIYRELKKLAGSEQVRAEDIRLSWLQRGTAKAANPPAPKETLLSVVEKFAAYDLARPELEARSVAAYRLYLEKYIKPTIQSLGLADQDASTVSRRHIDQVLQCFKKGVHPDINSVAYQGKLQGYVRTICLWAFSFDYFKVDPMAGMKIHRGKTAPLHLTHGQQALLRQLSLTGSLQHARDMFVFQMETGLNYEDSRQVRKSGLCWEDGLPWLRVTRDKSKEGRGEELIADVCLSREAYEIAERYQWIINPMSNQDLNRWLKPLGAMIDLSFDLCDRHARSTFTQNKLDQGIDRTIIKAMLGHKIGDTLDAHYARPSRRTMGRHLRDKDALEIPTLATAA